MPSPLRRPAPLRSRGVALSILGLVAVLAGACDVKIDAPDLSDEDRTACDAFLADLPATLADEERRDITPSDAPGAAYGDPAITVTCGASVPDDFDPSLSSCEVANGVGWYVPPAQFDDQDSDVTITAAGYRPVVQVQLPHDYRPDGAAAVIAQLAKPVDEHLQLVENCD